MSVRLLHMADVHLGRAFAQLDQVGPIRRQDLINTFQRICDVAIEKDVAAVLVSGDLFDSFQPSGALVEAVQRQVLRLTEAHIRVFIIPGEYDGFWYRRSIWRMGVFPEAYVFPEPIFNAAPAFEVDGVQVHVHGVAYNARSDPDPLHSLRRVDSGINLAMMHATVDSRPTSESKSTFFPLSLPQLLHTDMDYIALGHHHQRQLYSRSGHAVACYPGSPEGLGNSESGPRYVALLEFAGGPPVVEFIPVNGREVRNERLNVTGLSTDEVVHKLRQFGGDNTLLSARLAGYPDELLDIPAIRDRLKRDLFWLDLDDQTRLSSSELVERMAHEATIAGKFVHTLRRRIHVTADADERATLELALKLGLTSLRESKAP